MAKSQEKAIEVEVQATEVEVLGPDNGPQPGTQLALPPNLKALLDAEAKELAKRIQAPGGDLIKVTKDKHFKLPDGTKHAGPLSVVILDFVSTNLFFDRPYKEGEITPPACFAIGLEPTSLVPSSNSPDKQADSCRECPNNEFGSKGNGKACGNHRLLAVVAGTGEDAKDPNSQMYLLRLSPTAVKSFDGYVSSIRTQFGYSPIVVVTDIFFDPNVEYQSLRFGNPQPNANLQVHMARRAAARERLLQEPDVSGYEKPTKKGKR